MLEDRESTELVQVLSRQSILAQADKESLVGVQNAARFQHLQTCKEKTSQITI